MKKYFVPVLLLFLALASSPLAQDSAGKRNPPFPAKTKILNAPASKMLVGRHKISLQWISWDYFGVANVTNRRGIYYLKGEQKGRGTTDLVTVDGVISSIDAKEFKFIGTIVTQVSHIFGGKPCTREGEMTLRITGKRKYWRLQQIDNPCEAVADYVDIYFR
jgi:hypothetical protein